MTAELFSARHRRDVFDAICAVWEFSVASLLPNGQALADELARLQEHTGLGQRPETTEDTKRHEYLYDSKGRELVEVVRTRGVCPRADACKTPDADQADCAGCLAAWDALDQLEAMTDGR